MMIIFERLGNPNNTDCYRGEDLASPDFIALFFSRRRSYLLRDVRVMLQL
ncbi:hypothetical protein Bca101_025736 [Brassica carinata]